MAIKNPVYDGFTVASATVIEANRFVKGDSTGVVRCVANDRALGVSAEPTANGETTDISVAVLNASARLEVTSGGAVAKGAAISSDPQGRAVTRTSTNPILGYAKKAVSGAGETLEFTPAPGA